MRWINKHTRTHSPRRDLIMGHNRRYTTSHLCYNILHMLPNGKIAFAKKTWLLTPRGIGINSKLRDLTFLHVFVCRICASNAKRSLPLWWTTLAHLTSWMWCSITIQTSILKYGSLEKEAPSNASNWLLNTSRKMLVPYFPGITFKFGFFFSLWLIQMCSSYWPPCGMTVCQVSGGSTPSAGCLQWPSWGLCFPSTASSTWWLPTPKRANSWPSLLLNSSRTPLPTPSS